MGCGGCGWVMAVVWWLCVCELREVSKMLSYVNDFRHPRLTLVQSTTTVIVYHKLLTLHNYCTDYLDQSKLSLT